MNNSRNRYFVKNTSDGVFQDITTLFDGVAVLKVDGILAKGKPVNIYTAQWVNSQVEDFMITTLDQNDRPIVIRENVDIELTFIVHQKYATNTIDVQEVHDSFASYMTGSDVWIRSSYVGNKYVHCVCLKDYKPTTVKLQRGINSYIIGTISFHTLDAPVGE
jgi:hypothetical protein